MPIPMFGFVPVEIEETPLYVGRGLNDYREAFRTVVGNRYEDLSVFIQGIYYDLTRR